MELAAPGRVYVIFTSNSLVRRQHYVSPTPACNHSNFLHAHYFLHGHKPLLGQATAVPAQRPRVLRRSLAPLHVCVLDPPPSPPFRRDARDGAQLVTSLDELVGKTSGLRVFCSSPSIVTSTFLPQATLRVTDTSLRPRKCFQKKIFTDPAILHVIHRIPPDLRS